MPSKDHCQQKEDYYPILFKRLHSGKLWLIVKAGSLFLYITNTTMVHRTDCKLGFTCILNFDLSNLSTLGRELSSTHSHVLPPSSSLPKP